MAVLAGMRPRPASMLEGSRLCGKETSSPNPESGEWWTPLGKVTLVPEDRETQGILPPSSVLSVDVCLSICFSTPFCIEQTIQDLLKAAEKVFNNRETPEEREERLHWEERELAEKIRKEDREHRAKENWKNQRPGQDSFCEDEGQNRIEGASRPPDGRTRETKMSGPKERSVHLLQRTRALEKRVP